MGYLRKTARYIFFGVAAALLGGVAYFGPGFGPQAKTIRQQAMTIHQLLGENRELKQAITNLTDEDQIGYAKVISQTNENGRLLTTIRFVETARDDKTRVILQKECTIEGNVVHFDALIVKFGDKMVLDGKGRALYLWRRIYGESMPPEAGYPIEECGAEPKRYAGLLKALPIEHRQLFWTEIWDLANNLDKLAQHDIKAIYGSVLYHKLEPGLIYVFKISPLGGLYPEAVPDM
jgi:hypothetical protein